MAACFQFHQLAMTKKAAELAGIEVQRLVSEPTAAVIGAANANGRQTADSKGIYCVFDFGGGTLDISVVDCSFEQGKPRFQVKCTVGDSFLGGLDIDLAIFNWAINSVKDQINFQPSAVDNDRKAASKQRAMEKLRLVCRRAKEQLSLVTEVFIEVPNTDESEDDISIMLSRSQLESLLNMPRPLRTRRGESPKSITVGQLPPNVASPLVACVSGQRHGACQARLGCQWPRGVAGTVAGVRRWVE